MIKTYTKSSYVSEVSEIQCNKVEAPWLGIQTSLQNVSYKLIKKVTNI